MRILVVEDAITSAALICQLLEKIGMQSHHVINGEDAIEIFKQERFDLVLLDIVLPGMDGFDVVRKIRLLEKAGEWTPVIFLSASSNEHDIEKGIEAGGDDYLTKPVSQVVLKAKLKAMQRLAVMRQSLLTLTRKLDETNRMLIRISSVDGLTGVANRRCFDETLQREWRQAMRYSQPLSLLIADVDQFKQFNDNYGHQAGDECLKAVAKTFQSLLFRARDLVARYGGEEFGIILPDTGEPGAVRVAETLRQSVYDMKLRHDYSSVAEYVTISIGVATLQPNKNDSNSCLEIIQRADKALYAAKNCGRNRVVHWGGGLAVIATSPG